MEKKKKDARAHARVGELGEGEGNPGKNWMIFFANYCKVHSYCQARQASKHTALHTGILA